MNIRILFQLVVLTFILNACSQKGGTIEQHKDKIYVKAYKVGLQEEKTTSNYLGVVEEEISASISFPLTGNIDAIKVSEGQKIKQGDLLATLNDYSLKNAHSMALATLNQAEDAMQRIQMLYDNRSLPEIQYIEMQTNLEKARATEAIARKNMNDSKLKAPFSGVVGKIKVEAGENVLPNEPVLTLLKISNVHVKVAVPENEINKLKVGQSASVRISAVSDDLFSGKVISKGVISDAISHTYPVLILVENNDFLLLPGMVSEAQINSGNSNSKVVVPNNSILIDGDGNYYVWKLMQGKATKQVVKIGKQNHNGVEILNGLIHDDVIITDGYQKVSNGQKVEVL